MVKSCLASEQSELMALIQWSDLKGIPLVHHANERVCSARSGAIFKRMGVRKGYPDLSLLEPHGGYFGLFIELKQKRSYSPSEMKTGTWINQREWLTRLANNHYYSVMAFGWDEARRIIEQYLSWPRTTFLSMVNEHA